MARGRSAAAASAATGRPSTAGPELRVEELAQRAGTSVDTIRFYQKRRLLPPPRREGRIAWYGEEHVARLSRVRDLQRQGFSLTVIRRFLDGELDPTDEPLAAAVAGEQFPERELLDADTLAARAGIPVELVDAVAREGLIVRQRRGADVGYAADDVELLRAGLRLLEVGFPLPELLDLAKRHHDATRAIANDAVELFDEHVRRPLRDAPLTDDEKSERLVAAFRTLLPTATALVAGHFRATLLEVAQEHLEAVGDPSELAAARDHPDWDAPT